jgi:L,D-transpeptidase YcbB
MKLFRHFTTGMFTICLLLTLSSCKGKKSSSATMARTPGEMQEKSITIIQQQLQSATSNGNKLDSATTLRQPEFASFLYEQNGYEPLWCRKQQWLPAGDSLFSFINSAGLFGLFRSDYHFSQLDSIRHWFMADSLTKGARKDVNLWAKADMMFTDGFIQLIHDIKLGRLPKDSITLRKDSVLTNELCLQLYNEVKETGAVHTAVSKLEPGHKGYHQLKAGIKKFLDNYDSRSFTFVPTKKDPLKFVEALQQRLFEGGYISFNDRRADSATLAAAIKNFQKEKGVAADGVAGDGTLRMLNGSDNAAGKYARTLYLGECRFQHDGSDG